MLVVIRPSQQSYALRIDFLKGPTHGSGKSRDFGGVSDLQRFTSLVLIRELLFWESDLLCRGVVSFGIT